MHEFAPDVDKLTLDSPAPLLAGSDGRYPVPQPGINKTRRVLTSSAIHAEPFPRTRNGSAIAKCACPNQMGATQCDGLLARRHALQLKSLIGRLQHPI